MSNGMKLALASMALSFAALPGAFAQDPANGERIFQRCAACHGIGDTTRPLGPNLNGVIGRTAGTLEEFAPRYSEPMKQAGADGLAWTTEEIDDYLENPRTKIPGNRMAFPGLPSETDRADVIAYIETFSE